MTAARIIPTGPEVLREALIVLAGAAIAALVVSQVPALRAWLQSNGPTGCDCRR
ncbi:MAG: hypothetical protein ACOYLX_12225 [Burkholderiaceae bacterium]